MQVKNEPQLKFPRHLKQKFKHNTTVWCIDVTNYFRMFTNIQKILNLNYEILILINLIDLIDEKNVICSRFIVRTLIIKFTNK